MLRLLLRNLATRWSEGSDLVMRDARVWMRSLGRLEPVDVILRRLDAGWCDPLELRPESQLGAPGLLEACRLGTVSVVNTLGSGVLENAGLLAYLPALSQHLLGQPLRLPCAPTWWCGEEGGRRRVLADLERLVLRPVSRTDGATSIMGWQLSRERLDDLRRAIEARPEAWVGQEPIQLASAPVVGTNGLEARRSVLRAFVVSRAESYAAMPGGLTRVAADGGDQPISNQAGAISKDTWVLASEPEKLTGFWLQPGPAVVAVEPEGSMSSRAAENLFWLGRYAERAEAMARLLREVHERRNDFGHTGNPAGTACLEVLFTTLTHVSATYPGFLAATPVVPSTELASLVADASRAGTLAFCLRRMLDAAYAVRDQLSPDTWLVVGGLERELVGLEHGSNTSRTTLGRTMQSLLALAGLGAESMVRDPGWLFMDLGRRIERGLQLAALLRAAEIERGTATDSLVLESVLKAAESIITYRRRCRSHAQLETLLDLLLLDGGNPRSMRYQVDRVEEHVAALPGADNRGRPNAAQRGALRASAAVRLADTGRLARADDDGARRGTAAAQSSATSSPRCQRPPTRSRPTTSRRCCPSGRWSRPPRSLATTTRRTARDDVPHHPPDRVPLRDRGVDVVRRDAAAPPRPADAAVRVDVPVDQPGTARPAAAGRLLRQPRQLLLRAHAAPRGLVVTATSVVDVHDGPTQAS